MKKLELWYPVKPVLNPKIQATIFNQKFGVVDPKYSGLGMKGHNGIDFFAQDGEPVRATHDGVVTYAGLDGANGNLIIIMTENYFEYKEKPVFFKTLYGHLKTGTYKVTAGTKVKIGDIVALADNTGFSTGSHLHFGLKPVLQGEQPWQYENLEQNNGYRGAIDPMPYFNRFYAVDTVKVIENLEGQVSLLQRVINLLTAIRDNKK